MQKLPPIEKIPEAYSAIADVRIELNENKAEVFSSDYSKKYTVTYKENVYSSNDNGTYWQGYAGYPVIALLMLQNRLPLDRDIASYFKGINWTALNKKYKRKYDKAVEEVFEKISLTGKDVNEIRKEINKVYKEMGELPITIKRSGIKIIRMESADD